MDIIRGILLAFVRTREVGVSSRNVVSRTFPHFSQSMLTPMIRKKRGPRTLPWGTPAVTLMEEDISPSRRTCCVRLVRNECTQLEHCLIKLIASEKKVYSRIHIRIRHPIFAIRIVFVTWCIRSSPTNYRPRNSFFWVVAKFCYQVRNLVAKLILW